MLAARNQCPTKYSQRYSTYSAKVEIDCLLLLDFKSFLICALASTLKRHGYYCRSRKAINTSRVKSCIACVRAKTRCDNRRPQCSKCLDKAAECHYPAGALRVTTTSTAGSHGSDAVSSSEHNADLPFADQSAVESLGEAGNEAGASFDAGDGLSGPIFGDLSGVPFDPTIDIADYSVAQTDEDGVQYNSSESSFWAHHPVPSTGQANQVQQTRWFSNAPVQSLSTYSLRLFNHRPNLKTNEPRITNLLLHTLKSYPLMMMRDNNLPPYIHPQLIASSNVENDNMEPLNNCISLVHMLSSGIHGSRKLFWKNVRTECERLYAAVR